MPLARARQALIAAFAIALALVAASTSLGSSSSGAGCAPIVRTIQNGDPAVTEGALRVTVDGLGEVGRGTVGAGAASFNPAGTITTYRRHNKPALGPVGDSLDDFEPPFGGAPHDRR